MIARRLKGSMRLTASLAKAPLDMFLITLLRLERGRNEWLGYMGDPSRNKLHGYLREATGRFPWRVSAGCCGVGGIVFAQLNVADQCVTIGLMNVAEFHPDA